MKDIFLIKGLAGKRKLSGKLPVYGAKNAALPAFASSILFQDEITLDNVPYIQDIEHSAEILRSFGADVERTGSHSWTIDTSDISSTTLDVERSKHMRASIVFAGPILARFGQVSFPHPGGCVLGERPVDIFLSAFEKMGAEVSIENEIYKLKAKNKKLHGAEIFLRVPSHTVTETIMMTAVLSEGTTVIKNASMEPEITNVADYLISCGAKISGVGTPTVTIIGTGMLSAKGKKFHTVPDRIEAGSFIVLAAMAGEELTVTDCEPQHLDSLTASLISCGVPLTIGKNFVSVKIAADFKSSNWKGVNIKTHEYPGFPTDLQAPMSVFLTQVGGESNVFETIFDGRLNYTGDLIKMGADMKVWSPHTMTVKGPVILKGRELFGPDIRAGLAYVLAAIIAKGRSVINNVHYVDRGYERIEDRLKSVGVDIERVSN